MIVNYKNFLMGYWCGNMIAGQRMVKLDTPTATTYLYGREADSVVSYNGVPLPDIETVWTDEVKAECPYAMQFDMGEYGYALYLTNVIPTVNGDTTTMMNVNYSAYLLSDGVWTLGNSETDGNTNIPFMPFWTSHDILNSDGTTYLAASDPVLTYTDPDVYIGEVGYYGAVLQKLPEWDKETYPYAFIRTYTNFGQEWLTLRAFAEYDTTGEKVSYGSGVWGSMPVGNKEWYNTGTHNAGEQAKSGIMWANFDILNDDGSVYLKGTEPIPVGEIVGYSYNGTVLPELPEWDVETYPYACIYQNGVNDDGTPIYRFEAFTTKLCYGFNSSYPTKYAYTEDGKSVMYTQSDSTWDGPNGPYSRKQTATLSSTNIIWSNYDILDTAEAVNVAATTPITIYE